MTTVYKATGTAVNIMDNQFNTDLYSGTVNGAGVGIQLPGRNVTNYGGPIAQNFLQITENFAGATPPTKAALGQTWFNTTNKMLYVKTDITTEPIPNWSKMSSTVNSSGGTVRIPAELGGGSGKGPWITIPMWNNIGFDPNLYTLLASITVPRTGAISISFAFGLVGPTPGIMLPVDSVIIADTFLVDSSKAVAGNNGCVGQYTGGTIYLPTHNTDLAGLTSVTGTNSYLPVTAGATISLRATVFGLPYTGNGPFFDWHTADNNGESYLSYHYVA